MCIKSVMPSNYLILCCPLLLPPIPPSIKLFSNEPTLCMRWAKYWSFSLSISPSNEHPGLISFRMDWLGLCAVQGTLKSLMQHHSSKASIRQHSALVIDSHIRTCRAEGMPGTSCAAHACLIKRTEDAVLQIQRVHHPWTEGLHASVESSQPLGPWAPASCPRLPMPSWRIPEVWVPLPTVEACWKTRLLLSFFPSKSLLPTAAQGFLEPLLRLMAPESSHSKTK